MTKESTTVPGPGSGRPTTSRRPWRRRLARAAAVTIALPLAFVAVNVALIWDDAPVSHWKSPEAQARFERAYDTAMTHLPSPSTTLDIPTDFGTVRAYRFEPPTSAAGGDRAPLVLLPGHSAPTPMWLSNLEGLAAARPVIAIDLLGQPGRSVPNRPVTDAADQAAWLEQTLEGLGESRVHLLGVSFGGWTAMNYVRHHPRRVASVSLLDPVFVFAPIRARTIVAAGLTLFPLMPSAYTDWFLSWTAGGAPIDDDTVEASIIGAGMAEYTVVEPTPAQFSEAELRAIRVPVLAVMAGRSVMHDAQAAVRTGRATVPEIDMRLEPDASHAINGELADSMNGAVLAFAARHD